MPRLHAAIPRRTVPSLLRAGVGGPATVPLWAAWALVVATSGAAAAPPPGPVQVEALVAEALAVAPDLAALAARAAAAHERVGPAGAPPDPMVEVMLQDVGFPDLTVGEMDMSMLGVELRQGVPWPGKRGSRRAAAAAEAATAETALVARRRELAAEVRELAARLYALDRERAALAQGRELLAMLAATVAARYAAGLADQAAALRQELAVARVDERSADLDAERAAVTAALNRLRGRPGGEPIGALAELPAVPPSPWLPPPPSPPGDWEERAAAASPAVALARRRVAAAERQVAAARLDERPDLFAGAGYGHRGGLDPVVTLRLGVELPLWRGGKQAAARRATEWEAEAMRRELAAVTAAARAEAAALAARWRAASAQVALYRESIVPRSAATLDASRAAYLAGGGDFAAVVDDFRLWLDSRVDLARREAERFAVWARLTALLGEDQPPAAGDGDQPAPPPPAAGTGAQGE